MRIYCPNCALPITVEPRLMGSRGQCPSCSHKFLLGPEHRQPPLDDDLGTAPTIKMVREEAFDFDLAGDDTPWLGSPSSWAALVGGGFLLVAVLVLLWMGGWREVPDWVILPAALHGPLGYGGLALLVASLAMEGLGRLERWQHLQEDALPLLLGMTFLALFGADLTGACSRAVFGAHTVMALFAHVMVWVALVISLRASERPETDRSLVLVSMALGVGALLLTGYLGGLAGTSD